MKLIPVLFVFTVATGMGCGQKSAPMFMEKDQNGLDRDANQLMAGHDSQNASKVAADQRMAGGEENQPRKIVYHANVELVVDDLEKAEQELNQILIEQGGYVAKSEVRGSPGSPRSGTWTVRVPVEHFPVFMEAAGKLGELRRSSTDSDDITDKYFDLKAHLKNNQVEEEGLRKLLLEKSAGGKLDDILAIRKELRGIRGDIEQQQGQIQRWEKETALATVTFNLHDRKDYVPPTSPDLRASIGRTFEGSLNALQTFGRWLVLVIVGLVPWLPVFAIVLGPTWFWMHRLRSRPKVG